MSIIPDHFKLHLKPLADPKAVIRLGAARFTILTERLIRLEYQAEERFEDRASQAIWYRQQPVPQFVTSLNDNVLEIETAYLYLRYQENGENGFSPANLAITIKANGHVWHPNDPTDANLLGTTRTLDFINGYAPLNTGLMSREGWSVIDDSQTLVFNDDYWIEPRAANGIDWYFLGYGHDYKACLYDYCQISGKIPMIPRWILGNWWSRYWHYSQAEFTQLIHDFKTYELPFSVCIIDMDWHITNTGNESSGWTGYTWNRELFPDPQAFIDFLHKMGLKTALNLHPADGIHSHEAQYPEMAQRTGIDPDTKQPVPFNIASPEFAKAYFEVLHHPYEQMGIDFWWIDWQQGLTCDLEGLDPLWLINHLHFYDLGRDGKRRPFVFSRWGNEGHQRYPIGFSGDTYRTWESLRFQPYMTATASNIAYGWWSHDIGGHTSGTGDAELFTRWVQFGAFSPIMRLHVGKGLFYDSRPWLFDEQTLGVLRDALQWRHAFIPYLYTMAHRAHQASLPLMLPMYYDYPEAEAAYHCPDQYLYGSELIAAPFVSPADPDTGLSRQVVWLPEGDWYNFFSGEHFTGNSWQTIYGDLADIPLFAKAGAIIPLAPKTGWGGVENPSSLDLHIFAGADNRFTLYEDDGESSAYQSGHCCQTTIEQIVSADGLKIVIHQVEGDSSLIPAERQFNLHLHGVQAALAIDLSINGQPHAHQAHYDAATETLIFDSITLTANEQLQLHLEAETGNLLSHRERGQETVLHLLSHFKLHTGVRNKIAEELPAILADPAKLAPYIITMSASQNRALFETLCGAGVHVVHDTAKPTSIVVWNNQHLPDIRYRYRDAYLHFGVLKSANHNNGHAPCFAHFAPPTTTWQQGALQADVHRSQWQIQLDYLNLWTFSDGYQEKTP